MNFDLDKHTIFKCIAGSNVYGTNTKDSDLDTRGIAIPPREYFTGYLHNFEQHEDKVKDIVIWSLKKFMKLAADNNPNIIELLFIPRKFWIVNTPYWREIVKHRMLFMSKKVKHTFTGYAYSQLKRIDAHRGFLLQGEIERPRRIDFDLPVNNSMSTEEINERLSLT